MGNITSNIRNIEMEFAISGATVDALMLYQIQNCDCIYFKFLPASRVLFWLLVYAEINAINAVHFHQNEL
jgi:hypothetical protein